MFVSLLKPKTFRLFFWFDLYYYYYYYYHSFFFPQGHSSFVTHLDWSKDSQYLVTNSGDYEILFCKSPLSSCVTRICRLAATFLLSV